MATIDSKNDSELDPYRYRTGPEVQEPRPRYRVVVVPTKEPTKWGQHRGHNDMMALANALAADERIVSVYPIFEGTEGSVWLEALIERVDPPAPAVVNNVHYSGCALEPRQ
jgi:hypothetical protein